MSPGCPSTAVPSAIRSAARTGHGLSYTNETSRRCRSKTPAGREGGGAGPGGKEGKGRQAWDGRREEGLGRRKGVSLRGSQSGDSYRKLPAGRGPGASSRPSAALSRAEPRTGHRRRAAPFPGAGGVERVSSPRGSASREAERPGPAGPSAAAAALRVRPRPLPGPERCARGASRRSSRCPPLGFVCRPVGWGCWGGGRKLPLPRWGPCSSGVRRGSGQSSGMCTICTSGSPVAARRGGKLSEGASP